MSPARLGRATVALLARLDIFTPRGAYVARSIAAAALALGVAYLLELETPYSAASTVLLVINPVQGAV
ncbi:FUSC family protein, partial [Burkholderia pseudomallei]